MSHIPDPMTPIDCDLRGLDYMPLFGNHLFGSEFNAAASDSEWRAAVTLWWAAWNQVPAGSLPDDDVALCRLADLGRDVKTWKKLRERTMRGFTLCSDGRLYHRFLAKQACIAWDLRQAERLERDNEKQRKARERLRRARLFSDLEAAGITPAWNTTGAELSRLHAEHCHADRSEPVTRTGTAKKGMDGTGRDGTDVSPEFTTAPDPAVVGGAAQTPAPPPPPFRGEANAKAIPKGAVVPLAGDWELPETWGTDAEALGFTPPEILRESERFRQYWVSGKGAGQRRALKGWRQSWSNWLAKAEPHRRNP